MSSIVEQVGRVIGGRYRLLAVVGAGASAQVFAADDTRLGRRVAVKLLHPALAGDATFLRKFQAEARLAASLNHRNILHVYDWGDENGMPYLVLEYLGGGSLRSLLDTGSLLTPQQAAALGAQAAHGLAFAHRRGLVHRDIKPANILFDDDGRLLVADFGLARALAEAAITEPLGTVMGTARYASPEQVEGRHLDDRTDVYSLALTLYESVTGRVPFAGDTTVATLMARVGAVLPPARELGPLAPVLAQAAISEPLARLDAASLASELEMLLGELPPPERLPLSRADLALPSLPRPSDPDPTERLEPVVFLSPAPPPPRMAQPPQTAQPPPQTAQASQTSAPPPYMAVPAPPAARPVAAPTTAVLPGVRRILPAPDETRIEPSRRRRKHRLLPWLLAVLALEMIAGAAFLVVSRPVVHHPKVPLVVGRGILSAESALRHAGLTPEVSREQYSGRAAVGVVIAQFPRPAARVKPRSIVDMVISEGRHPTAVPSLAGMTEANASSALKRAHLVGQFSGVYSETATLGTVLRWSSLAGTKVFYGDKVGVVISKGPAPQVLPSDLSGGLLTWTQASSLLTDLHLTPTQQGEYSASIRTGSVISTRPSPGATVPGHSSVLVYVSLGPPFVKVPALYPDSAPVAEQQLRSLDLKWRLFGPPGSLNVISQHPLAGSYVRLGSTINVYLF